MEKIFIKDLQDKQTFHCHFLAKEKSLHTGKNGRSYLSLTLSDKSGSLDARVWDNVEEVDRAFQSGDIIRVKGQIQLFQNRRQAVVHRLEKAEEGSFSLADFLSGQPIDPEGLFRQLMGIVEGVYDSHVRQLIMDVLTDPSVRERLLKSPAAKTIHHAKAGGLLEHIVSICQVMRLLSSHYRQLNSDLLIFGAIFHDIGKIWELELRDDGIYYTDEGRLVGHLVLASEIVEKKASRILGFPENLKMVLKHIILSHHNLLEYGSPKRPKFLEALVVAMVDDLDSKIDTLSGVIGQETDSWTKYNQLFDRYFYTKATETLQKPPQAEDEES